jgi:hypothetical protein
MIRHGRQERSQFIRCVLTGGSSAFDHQLDLLDHLISGVRHQKLVGGDADQDGAGAEQRDQDQIEFGEKLQLENPI